MQFNPETEQQLLAVATEAAGKAGQIQTDQAGEDLKVDQTMPYDVKLEVDRLCEEAIVSTIRQAFADHSILTEEGGADQGRGEYRWIIDPLDGTVNYFYGIPYYCTSIACYADPRADTGPADTLAALGLPMVAVVYCPSTDEMFTATASGPCLMNGRTLQASRVASLSEAMVCVGYGNTESGRTGLARATNVLAGRVRKIRCLGAAAYDLANVAAGRLSVFFEKGLRTWDIAAGALLVRRAGGVFRATEFEPTRWRVFAAGANVAEEAYAEFLEATDW
jgi:fructose-1,6-bisphosphatase/inositol monophosphatase family enzyme